MPRWSHDGRSVYFIAQRNAARSLWKKPIDGGAPVHVADGVVTDAIESHDGSRLYYSKATPGLWEASASGADERLIPELADVVHSRYFYIGEKGVYFVGQVKPPWQVRVFDFATRRVTTVATIDKTLVFMTPSLSISPDGNSLLFAQLDQVGSEISMSSDFGRAK